MLITKEHQEAIISNYIKSGKSQDECLAFIEGFEKAMSLINKKSEPWKH
jgi:hypothetical protein